MQVPTEDWNTRSKALGALLARVRLGDREAFAAIYRQTRAHLFGVILRINPDRAQAEELLQDVFVNVWRSAQSFDASLSQPLTWLISVARHRAIDSVRRDEARPRTVSATATNGDDEDDHDMLRDFPSPDAGPAERAAQDARARELTACMQRLSSEQRQCLALAFYQGLSHAEVADHMTLPLGTVKSWVRRAMLSLKDCLVRRARRQPEVG